MSENKYVIDDILNAVVDEKPVDLQAALNSIMVDKAHDYISNMKSQLMSDMLSAQEDEEEEVEIDVDEIEIDTEEMDDEEIDADEVEFDTEDEVEELDAEELFNDLETTEDETDNQG